MDFCVSDSDGVTAADMTKYGLLCQKQASRTEIINSSPLDKMAAILADDIFNCISLNEDDRIPIRISLKYVPRSPIDNKATLVQVMACRRTGAIT